MSRNQRQPNYAMDSDNFTSSEQAKRVEGRKVGARVSSSATSAQPPRPQR
jgi:hypothetical protein